jgi:tripartite-type tricarboxylate transporter receptor subunit TctC
MLERRRLVAGLVSVPLLGPGTARGQEVWPARPVRIVVPWPPGGAVDTFARIIQAPLSARIGRPVVIENISGGAGRVGAQSAARAADGHTFVLVNDTFAAAEALTVAGMLPLLPALTPVALAVSGPQGLFTHRRSGFATVEAFLAAAAADPGGLNVGVQGIGSSQHLTSELILRAAGDLSITHVPYRGGGPLLQDLAAGNIDAGVVAFAAGAAQAGSGRLVPLAVTSGKRLAAHRDVPTISETVAPGFVQTTWQGFLAPRPTPVGATRRFHAAVASVLREPAVVGRLEVLGLDPAGLDGAAFGSLLARTAEAFAEIAKACNVAPDG